MLKIVRKLGQPLNLPDFRIIFNIFAKMNFALKFNLWRDLYLEIGFTSWALQRLICGLCKRASLVLLSRRSK